LEKNWSKDVCFVGVVVICTEGAAAAAIAKVAPK